LVDRETDAVPIGLQIATATTGEVEKGFVDGIDFGFFARRLEKVYSSNQL
jgi:hypothetical protein